MGKKWQKQILVSGIVLLAVLIDQIIKICVKTQFQLGESREVTSWFWICFVENNGMAFGIEWFDKIFLTLFRILAAGLLSWYAHIQISREHTNIGYLSMISLIIAGAIGNIIDCVFYGKIWGYADWFYGRVVDMFYFPLIHNADGEVLFFQPVFNFADSCITCAVIAILIWYRKELDNSANLKNEK